MFGCMVRVASWLAFVACLATTAIGADDVRARNATAPQSPSAIDVEIVSIKPTGLGNHFQDWVAVGHVATNPDDKPRVVFLYMHSPVLALTVPADEAIGRSFRVVVLRQQGAHVFKFEVERVADAK